MSTAIKLTRLVFIVDLIRVVDMFYLESLVTTLEACQSSTIHFIGKTFTGNTVVANTLKKCPVKT